MARTSSDICGMGRVPLTGCQAEGRRPSTKRECHMTRWLGAGVIASCPKMILPLRETMNLRRWRRRRRWQAWLAARPAPNRSLVSSGRWPSKEHHAVATASNLRCCSTGSCCCCCYCILLLSDMLLRQLLLVTLLVAPMGGAPAAPAPAPQEDVGEEGGGKADIKVRLPGSITRRAELFQRPRPRYVVWSQLWCPDVGAALMIRQFSKVQMLFFIVTPK